MAMRPADPPRSAFCRVPVKTPYLAFRAFFKSSGLRLLFAVHSDVSAGIGCTTHSRRHCSRLQRPGMQ